MNRNAKTLHVATAGLDLPLTGAPGTTLEDGRPVHRVALLAEDYVGMRPRLHVQEGESVVRGQLLFEDRKTEGVRYTSPAAGRISAIHRGEKRAFQSIVIELDDRELSGSEPAQVTLKGLPSRGANSLSSDEVRELLLNSGLWTALRSRPFGRVPLPSGPKPRSVFVTAMNTDPGAPDMALQLRGREAGFGQGLAALVQLVGEGRVHLCRGPGQDLPGEDTSGVVVHEFKGPHPSGTVGFHIHTIDPVGPGRVAYYLGAQDVADLGELLAGGKFPATRVIGLGGPAVNSPRHLRTRIGASLDELLKGEIAPGLQRIVSGSVLSGRDATGEVFGYLGRYHQQVSALSNEAPRRFLGWLAPGTKAFSVSRLFASLLLRPKTFDLSTDLHGGKRALIPTAAFERVMPFEMMPTFLLRSILAKDVETAEELGALELDEEDLALCSLVCPSKIEYGPALRQLLTQIEKEG